MKELILVLLIVVVGSAITNQAKAVVSQYWRTAQNEDLNNTGPFRPLELDP